MTLMGRSPQAVPRLNADVQEITVELLESGVVFTMVCDKNKALARLSIALLQNVLNFPAENKVKLQPHSVLGRLGLPSSPPGSLACDEAIHRQGAGFQRYFLTPELRTPC